MEETHGLTPPVSLSASDDLSRFACGHEELDDWLHRRALRAEGRSTRTYVVHSSDGIAGYYCLATGAERRERLPGKLARNVPETVPLMVIGRLAVDRVFQGRGIGALLLRDALDRILAAAEIVGCRAALVHAINDRATSFYVKYGFVEFPGGSRTLFLPIETIAAAIK